MNTLSEQGLRLFPETAENLPTLFTPLSVCVLSNLTVPIVWNYYGLYLVDDSMTGSSPQALAKTTFSYFLSS